MVSRGTQFDLVVVGAGHAGCEAALAAARLGCSVCLLTMARERVAEMACNPAIGGLGKSQIVREIDVLGGLMGRAADAAGIHFRRLNESRGPAVRARRLQCDPGLYHRYVLAELESCPGLELRQGLVEDLLSSAEGTVVGVQLESGDRIAARAVVLTTGTFLRGKLFTGLRVQDGGRQGDRSASLLTAALERLGLQTGRLKTGTPPRLATASIDFEGLEVQASQDPVLAFSHQAGPDHCLAAGPKNCYLTRTGPATHRAIRAGLSCSPLYTGLIQGVGPRYCPSIEDKVVRFADRQAHLVVLEPVDLTGRVTYPNGISTSLALDCQQVLVRSIPGLEQAEILVAGYAVEYDFVPPTQLDHCLQVRCAPGLFLAGQINGTSGYEEAAGQGLLAGCNAAARVMGRPGLVLERHQAYLGVMVDDLVSRGTREPYRMFSSRAEFRLLLREDNALSRLHLIAARTGLVPADLVEKRSARLAEVKRVSQELATTRTRPGPDGRRPSLEELLRRPEVRLADLAAELSGPLPVDVCEQVEVQIKYQGYVERQVREAERLARQGSRPIPATQDYLGIPGLSRELQEKLALARPRTLDEARRLDGMTPAALGVLSLYLERSEQARGGHVPRGTSQRRER